MEKAIVGLDAGRIPLDIMIEMSLTDKMAEIVVPIVVPLVVGLFGGVIGAIVGPIIRAKFEYRYMRKGQLDTHIMETRAKYHHDLELFFSRLKVVLRDNRKRHIRAGQITPLVKDIMSINSTVQRYEEIAKIKIVVNNLMCIMIQLEGLIEYKNRMNESSYEECTLVLDKIMNVELEYAKSFNTLIERSEIK